MQKPKLTLSTSVVALLLAACSGTEPSATNSSTAGAGATTPTAAGATTGGSGPQTGTAGAGANVSGGNSVGGAAVGASGSTTGGALGASGSPTTTTGGSGGDSGGAATGGSAPVVELPKLVTSTEGAYWKKGEWTEAPSGTADVTVNDTAAQTWEGFGGAFNEKGWEYLLQLSQTDRDMALALLFGADGARFNYGRIPIGASDYATSAYTLNENAGDTSMSKFSIERDKKNLIPFVKAALAVNPDVHLWASPWTPPTWMKSNGAFNRGNMKEDATTFDALALYLAKFVQEYAKEGIKIEAIHPQNEPGFEQDYPSCLWTGGGMAKFIGSHLGPTFEKQGVTASIFLGTMSSSSHDPAIVTAVTGDATAMKYVKGFGLQWGMLQNASGLKSRNLPIWQTEHKCGNYPFGDTAGSFKADKAPNDFAYGVESWGLLRDWIKAGVTSYSAWNMVLDPVGVGIDKVRNWPQNALIVVDTSSKKLIATPAYYVFRHFSQFVEPGAKVVGASGGDALAFKNPNGGVVAVMYNAGGAKKASVSIGGKLRQFDMPAKGWATVYAAP